MRNIEQGPDDMFHHDDGQTVALKLLHTSLMNAAMSERFMRERAILARLDHPQHPYSIELRNAVLAPEVATSPTDPLTRS